MALSALLTRLRMRYHPLWHLRRQRWFRWVQSHCDVPVCRRLGRVHQYVYLLRDMSQLLPHQGMEQKTADVFARLAASGRFDCFVDIGANIGNYSWIVAQLAPQARLVLFEPDRRNLRLLERTLARSRLPDAHLQSVALSDATGEKAFVVDDASGATGSLVDQHGAFSGYNLHDAYGLHTRAMVPTRRLDDYRSLLQGRRLLVKIDVEGAEHLVLDGAREVLATQRPWVFCESFEIWKLRGLARERYRVYSLGEDGNHLGLPAEAECPREIAGLDDITARVLAAGN
jgi:FkbM family methyltransferase